MDQSKSNNDNKTIVIIVIIIIMGNLSSLLTALEISCIQWPRVVLKAFFFLFFVASVSRDVRRCVSVCSV